MKRWLTLGLLAVLLEGCLPVASTSTNMDIFTLNQRLARTINLGNALEAPSEGEWGVVLQEAYFDLIAEAGFSAVRIPARFSAHAGHAPPYAIDPDFLRRVDWAVEQAIARGLTAIVDLHHYEEIFSDPSAEKERFLAIWGQLANHFRERPDELVFFELLNEPHDALAGALWNALAAETLAVVRRTNPTRPVILGPGNWNGFESLSSLVLPDDPYIIVTFHYYHPFEFTHQGAEWVEGADAWLGSTWNGTDREAAAIAADFDWVLAWAEHHNRPVFLGEFGAYFRADLQSRIHWTATVAHLARERGFTWGYWEFCSGFGIYDPVRQRWNDDLLHALIP
ncbi:MAG: glycoside hydrolase family 5 protein [Anaerolineales bacterium]|nr:glycoside hydrolase family 5 protein [Anaerolineales bacterium]